MESASELTPLVSVPPYRPTTLTRRRDVETGLHRFLTVEKVQGSLENRKVEVIKKKEILLTFLGGPGVGIVIGVFAFASCMLLSIIPSLLACPKHNIQTNLLCISLGYFDIPAALFSLIFLCASCLGCGAGIRGILRRKNQIEGNQLLTQNNHQLTFDLSENEPLTAKDFVSLYRQELIADDLISNLSFKQLQELKKECIEIFESTRDHWIYSQSAPWEKIELIRRATLGDLTETLKEDYIKTRIHDTPGFFEELLNVLSEDVFEDLEASEALLSNVRKYLRRHFDYDFSDDEIRTQLQEVLKGGALENCFRMAMSDERMIELNCGELTFNISSTVLMAYSGYFRAMLDFNKGLTTYSLEDLTEEQFEVFIQYLRGKKMPIDCENVEDFLAIAAYFQMKTLAEACETPLLLKFEDYELDEKLEFLESYPIISGRFKDHVDHEYAESLNLRDQKNFVISYARAKHLGFKHTMNFMKKSLLNEIKKWQDKESQHVTLTLFMNSVSEYKSLLPQDSIVHKKLIGVIHSRLILHKNELKIVYEMALENPTSLIIDAVYSFVRAKGNRDQVNGTFLAVKSKIKHLKEIKNRHDSDRQLISDIQEWCKTNPLTSNFDDFLSNIVNFYSSIQSGEFVEHIEDVLIDVIHSRLRDRYSLSFGTSLELQELYDVLQGKESPHPLLQNAFELFIQDKQHEKQVKEVLE
ncbi:MAG: hypothetical protein K940chlam3_01487 [Chlamydiae bacterium]|nr:hypothetical protein [Chlamydiota bacterium]